MSLPSIATVSLFSAVAHWNSWFDGIIYMNNPLNYPLQSYLQVMIMMASNSQELLKSTPEMADMLKKVGDSTLKAAQIILGSLPIIAVYPFLQRYFMKGIVGGSVKE
jgi:putative aldouronate transport system permease protein